MSVPPVPLDLFDHGMPDSELAELWHALVVELLDSDYIGRAHQNRRTYDAGCQGPLCRKAAREHSRRRISAEPKLKYVYLDGILDAWKPVAEARIRVAQQKILEALTAS